MKKRAKWLNPLIVCLLVLTSILPHASEANALRGSINSTAVTIGQVSGAPGDVVEVPVSLDSLGGAVYMYDIALTYDDENLEFQNVKDERQDDVALFDPIVEAGKGHFTWMANSQIDTAGKLLTLTFKIKNEAQPGVYPIVFNNEETTVTTDILAGFGLNLPTDTRLTDGSVTVASAETPAGITWKAGTSSAMNGETVTIPVSYSGLTKNMGAYGVKLSYDQTKLEAIRVNPVYGSSADTCDETSEDGCFHADFNNETGSLTAAWVDSSGGDIPLTGTFTDNVFTIDFKVKAAASPGETVISFIENESYSVDVDMETISDNFTGGKVDIIPGYSLAYDKNGAESGTVPAGGIYAASTDVTVKGNTGNAVKAGYRFTGWNTKADGSGTAYQPGGLLSIENSSVILYAQWIPLSANASLANVTLDNGALSPNFSSSVYTYTVNVPNSTEEINVSPAAADGAATVTVNGMAVPGGSIKNILLNTGSNPITVIVTAEDGVTTNSYTINVVRALSDEQLVQQDKEGLEIGYAAGDSETSVIKNVTLPTSGHNGSVISWESSGEAFVSETGTVIRPTFTQGEKMITLTATLTKGAAARTKTFTLTLPSLSGYIVGYDENGAMSGTVPEAVKYNPGDTASAALNSSSLAKPGYTFAGWNTEADGTGTPYQAGETFTITADSTLYAQWQVNSYTVSFDANGGTATDPKTIQYNQTLEAPTEPAKTGHAFAGWFKDEAFTSPWNFTEDKITEDTTLFAKWETNSYTVTFQSNSGSTVAPASVLYNTKLAKPENPARAGYRFAGWYQDEQLQTAFNFETPVTEDRTLYAYWASPFGSESSSKPPSSTENISVDVVSGDQKLVQTPIKRSTNSDGTVNDKVTFSSEKAVESIEKLKAAQEKTARIVIPDAQDKVTETAVDLPENAVKALEAGQANFEIATENARIFVPSNSLADFDEDLYFHLVPVKKEAEQKAIEIRAKQEEKIRQVTNSTETVTILGRPMTIETNMQSRPVTLTFPLPTNISQEMIDDIAVFIEHSDGTKEVVRGTVADWEAGQKALQFDVEHFSTFTMLYMQGAADYFEPAETKTGTHTLYIHGFKDGTFRPDETVTRAQIAAMLVRSLGLTYNGKVSYKDTNTSFAMKEIEIAREKSIIHGFKDGTFRPDQEVTRAQAAAIASRWVENVCKENSSSSLCTTGKEAASFTDVESGHWAAKSIQHASSAGLINGFGNGSFKPEQAITRAQAVVILNRLFERGPLYGVENPAFSDVPVSHWAFKEIEEAATNHQYEIDKDGKEIASN